MLDILPVWANILIAVVIVVGGVIIWFGKLVEGLKSIFGIFKKSPSPASTAQRNKPEDNLSVTDKLSTKRELQRVFPYGEKPDVIIHSIDDDNYPDVDEGPEGTISSWFKVEFCGHYHNGIEVYLAVREAIFDNDGNWAIVDDYNSDVNLDIYQERNVFEIGKIPFRNIVEVDDMGDEYYGSAPHLHCKFADDGMPYEDILYRPTGEGYQPELNPTKRFEFSDRRTQ